MPLTCEHSSRGPERANKVFVDTTISQDGRNTDGFWLECDQSVPAQSYALYLLAQVLEASPAVTSYSVYDGNGDRAKNFDSARFPKRV